MTEHATIYGTGDDGVMMLSNKLGMTPEGGYAVKMTNKTGAASVLGMPVELSATTDNAVAEADADCLDTIGVMYSSGVADGSEVWVVVSGIAQVLIKDGTSATHGNWVGTADTAGRADASGEIPSPPTAAQHFQEIGHCLESAGSGTDVFSEGNSTL